MKKIVFLFCSALMVASCNTKPTYSNESTHDFAKDRTTLYVITINGPETDLKKFNKLDELNPVKKDEIRSITDAHFEISLNKLENGSGYQAQRSVTDSAQKNPKMEYICDWCGGATTFKTAEGFLNFMSDRGYKLANQTENDYTFNKI